MPCQVTGTEENYYSIAIGKSDADNSHPKQAKKKKGNKIQVSNGDNAHTYFKEKTMRSIYITLVIGHISSWTRKEHEPRLWIGIQ